VRQFELFVALRYLRAKRKQAVISVITIISILGVAAGVMALIVALAINNGFRGTLQRNLLGATAHVSILEKEPGYGIENWRELVKKLSVIPGVTSAAPSLYDYVVIAGPRQNTAGVLKGIDPVSAATQSEALANLKQGSLKDLEATPSDGLPGIILGSKLAENTGMLLGSRVRIISPQGEPTPFGPRVTQYHFRVVGIFESGFYELDANWAYTSLASAQMVLYVPDVVNAIELRVADIYKAPEIARQAAQMIDPKLAATHWMDQNNRILSALEMEKVVTVITIGLIQLVGALNILIALVMMVMEKYKDIAILMSMGARHQQIRRIFMLQGVLIGVVGSALGLIAGYAISFLANRYQLVKLDEQVYSLAFVPFEPHAWDAIWIVGVAIAVSFLATIYPARNATQIVPVEALRYE
jgi:lipoprotein-releasing system permease protein